MADTSCALHSRALPVAGSLGSAACLLQPRSSRSVAALHRKNAGQQYPDDQRHAYENGATGSLDHEGTGTRLQQPTGQTGDSLADSSSISAPPASAPECPGPYGEEGGDHGYRQEVQAKRLFDGQIPGTAVNSLAIDHP